MLHESYQRKLMMMQHLQHPPAHTKASGAGRKFVYCFSFSLAPLGPDPLQAVGFANLARIDSTPIERVPPAVQGVLQTRVRGHERTTDINGTGHLSQTGHEW